MYTISGVSITGTPGQSYKLKLSTDAINYQKIDKAAKYNNLDSDLHNNVSESSNNFLNLSIILRECIAGE